MNVRLVYEQELGSWVVHHDGVELHAWSELLLWRSRIREELEKNDAREIYLLIDMNGLSLEPTIARMFGAVAVEAAGNQSLGVIRYGHPEGPQVADLRADPLQNRFPPAPFADREAAIEALQQIRALPAPSQRRLPNPMSEQRILLARRKA
jgi:hypothetical protein